MKSDLRLVDEDGNGVPTKMLRLIEVVSRNTTGSFPCDYGKLNNNVDQAESLETTMIKRP